MNYFAHGRPFVERPYFLAGTAVSTLGLTANAASEDENFEVIAELYIASIPALSPVNATYVGDHSADHELDQVDAAARQRTRDVLQALLADLDSIAARERVTRHDSFRRSERRFCGWRREFVRTGCAVLCQSRRCGEASRTNHSHD